MSRGSLSSIEIALDPGITAWTLRRLLRRVSDALDTPPLEPTLAVTRRFRPRDGVGLAAVRATVGAAIADVPWFAYDLDGFAATSDGTVGLRLVPSPPLAAAASAIESALSTIAVPTDLPDERFLIPAARRLRSRSLRTAVRTLSLARPPWYRRLFAPFEAASAAPLRSPLRPLEAIRLLVLVDGRPAAGYDLASRRWLSRPELGDRALLSSSLRTYRRARGFELAAPVSHASSETWMLADLHLGHPEIALFCSRPFQAADGGEMDRVLIGNWQRTVSPEDRAILIGDLVASPDPDAYRTGVAALTGRLGLVRGNHDPDLPDLVDSLAFESGGHRFLAIHDPADAPHDFDGWVIHGHLHDSDLRRFPFFDPVRRRINVSAETAGYRPVPLTLIRGLITEGADVQLIRSPELPAESGSQPRRSRDLDAGKGG